MALALTVGIGLWLVIDQDTDITDDFDLANAEFYLHDTGIPTEQVQLVDGVHHLDDDQLQNNPEVDDDAVSPGGQDDNLRIEIVEGPLYTDLDGDGHLDAAAILEHTGPNGWRAVYTWLWNEGHIEPVPWTASWQYNCITQREYGDEQLESLEGGPSVRVDGEEIPVGLHFSRNVDNRCEDLMNYASPFSVSALHYEGVPATTWSIDEPGALDEQHLGAASSECAAARNLNVTGLLPVADDAPLRLIPEHDSPEITGPTPVENAYVWMPEDPDVDLLDLRNGHVSADIVWTDTDERGCAWVPWTDVDQDTPLN